MFKIGEFSRLSRVSVKTLRFYDERGLLRPAHIEEASGYRFYGANQLPRLHRILALKDLGFTLEQIAPLLAAGLSLDQFKEILYAKKAEIHQRLYEEQATLARVEARLHVIEQEGTMSQYDVVLKKVDPIRVATIREILPRYSAVGPLIEEVCGFLGANGIRPVGAPIAIWHDQEFKEQDVDGSACFPIDVSATFTSDGRVKIEDLPAVETMATLVHHGSYGRLPEAYQALMTWIEANGYTVAGNNREVYLESHGNGSQTEEQCVTEVQFAVAKTCSSD